MKYYGRFDEFWNIIGGGLFWVAIIFVFIQLGLLWLLIIIAIILAMIVLCFTYNKKHPKCEHGIRDGKDKCAACEIKLKRQKEEKIRKDEEAQKKKEYHEKYERYRKEAIKALCDIGTKNENEIKNLSPKQFETTIANMFRHLGYKVFQTPFSNDHGKDAIMRKDGEKILVECKHYAISHKAGRPELQKFFAAIIEEKASFGYFICTGGFADTSIVYAKSNKILCIDIIQLSNFMQDAYPSPTDISIKLSCQECGEVVTFYLKEKKEHDYCSNRHLVTNNIWAYCNTNPDEICPKCGGKIIKNKGRYGVFCECSNKPICQYTRRTREEYPLHKM